MIASGWLTAALVMRLAYLTTCGTCAVFGTVHGILGSIDLVGGFIHVIDSGGQVVFGLK